MGFSDTQLRALARNVPARAVRSRSVAGKELTYVEGWYVLSEANRIFGFDGWDRETVETKCLQAREARGSFTAIYLARVRITVRANDRTIVRDGHGTGEAHADAAGEAHDRALKAAETDATKRALATFGKAFGLALYNAPGARGNRRTGTSAKRIASKEPNGTETACEDSAALSGYGRALAEPPSPEPPPADVAVFDQRAPTEAGGDERVAAVPAKSQGPRFIQQIDKSALAFPELQRVRDKDHLRFVAALPCLLCSATPSDAHHLRFAQPRAMARKVGDDFTVPLCRAHHRELHHSGNESAFWHDMGIEPLEIARQLWQETEEQRSAELAR